MAEEIGSAFVRLLPSLRGFGPEVQRLLSGELDGVAVRIGRQVGDDLADGITAGAEEARGSLRGVASALGGLTAALPAVAAVGTAVGGLAAGLLAAGLAGKAFQLAVAPQMEAVTEATQAAEKAEAAHEKATLKTAQAQKLAAQGGAEYEAALREAESATKAATDADALYQQQLAALPGPTREFALALAGLKSDHQEWSDQLAKDTMPVFTKGIEIARDLLPQLTPFVTAATTALGGFLDEVAAGVKSAGFREWAADMSGAAGPALSDFLTIVKNLAVGFAGLLQAFLPASAGVTGGLVEMTGAFAAWATGLKDSEGFAEFLDLADEGGGALTNLAAAGVGLLVALAPVLGATTTLANAFATVINNTPTPVLTAIAAALLGVKVGMMAYSTYSAIVTTANRVMASSSYLAISGWARMMAFGVMAYARIAGAAVVSATRTGAAWAGAALRSMATFAAQMVRTAITAVAQYALMAGRAVAWAAVMAAQWLVAFWPIALVIAAVAGLVALVIVYWDEIKAFTLAAWNWVWQKVLAAVGFMLAAVGLLGKIPGLVAGWFTSMKDRAIAQALALVGWLRGLPARTGSAIAAMAGVLRSRATTAFQSMRDAAGAKASSFLSWVRGLPGRISSAIGSLGRLLYGKGQDVVRGLWNGIQSMSGWIYGKAKAFVGGIVDGVKSGFGIFSPSKVMAKEVGRFIPPGIVQGWESNMGDVRSMAAETVQAAIPAGTAAVRAPASAGTTVLLDAHGMPRALVEWLRSAVRTEAGGSAERFFKAA